MEAVSLRGFLFFLGLVRVSSVHGSNLPCGECVRNPCSMLADPSDTTQHYAYCNKREGKECLVYSRPGGGGAVDLCKASDQILSSGMCQRKGFPSAPLFMPEESPMSHAVWDCKSGIIQTDTQRYTGFDIRNDIEGGRKFLGPGWGSPSGSSYDAKINICNVTSTTALCTNRTAVFQARLDGQTPFNPCIEIESAFRSGLVPISPNNAKDLKEGFNVSLGYIRCCSGNDASNDLEAIAVFKPPESCSEQNKVPLLESVNLDVIGECNLGTMFLAIITLPQLCENCHEVYNANRIKAISTGAVATAICVIIVIHVLLAGYRHQKSCREREPLARPQLSSFNNNTPKDGTALMTNSNQELYLNREDEEETEQKHKGLGKRDCNGMTVSIDETSFVLSCISPVKEDKLTKKGFSLETSDGFCSFIVPKDAVDDSINMSMSVFSDTNEYFSKTGKSLSNIVQILPHGVQLKKQAILKFKHNFIFNSHHPPNVTILRDKGEGKFLTLCTLSAMNETTAFKGGLATLLPDQIILKMKRFCRVCGRSTGHCLSLHTLVFLPSAMPSFTDFIGGVVMKMAITTKNEENRWKRAEEEREYKCKIGFGFDVCICDLDNPDKPGEKGCNDDKRGTPECTLKCKKSLGVAVKVTEDDASLWNVTSPTCIHVSYLRRVAKKPKHFSQPFDFIISLKSKYPFQSFFLTSIVVEIKVTAGEKFALRQRVPVKIQCATSSSPLESACLAIQSIAIDKLVALSKHLCNDWRFFGRHIGVPDAVITIIDNDYKNNSREQAYQMLSSWLKSNPENAEEVLIKKLKDYGLHAVADSISN